MILDFIALLISLVLVWVWLLVCLICLSLYLLLLGLVDGCLFLVLLYWLGFKVFLRLLIVCYNAWLYLF